MCPVAEWTGNNYSGCEPRTSVDQRQRVCDRWIVSNDLAARLHSGNSTTVCSMPQHQYCNGVILHARASWFVVGHQSQNKNSSFVVLTFVSIICLCRYASYVVGYSIA